MRVTVNVNRFFCAANIVKMHLFRKESPPKLTQSKEWKKLKDVLLLALKPHPEAMRDVVAALRRQKGG
jgi:hypothetical protein